MSVPLAGIVARLDREGLVGARVGAWPDSSGISVSSVTTDSRFVSPGSLFCAVRGTAVDGHVYLSDVAAKGAAAALVEHVDPGVPLTQVPVTDGRRAAAFAAAAFYGDPWRDLIFIGVTGTNGKTTTVSILRHLLAKTQKAASLGTLGLIGPDGEAMPGGAGLTTPGPAQFAEAMRRLVDSGVRAVAMEVSSHALEQDRVAAASYSAAIFTNLSRDHLDYHGSEEAYRAAKLRFVDLVRPGGILATNADDPAWEGIRREGAHLVRFGTQGRGEVQAENVEHLPEGTRWTLFTPSCTAEVNLPLSGIYNVYNALGASAALWGLGWTADQIAEGLGDLTQVPGRLERVPLAVGPRVLIDYAHTPDALERALRAVRPLTSGRVILVFGAGGNRDRGKRPEMGRVAARHADFTIVTTDNPRHEDPLKIAEEIESGMGAAARHRILDRREAIAHALEMAKGGDLVLLAGKGHETYQVWGDEYRPFDERKVVAEIMAAKGVTA